MFLNYIVSDTYTSTSSPIKFLTREKAQHNTKTQLISLFDNDKTQHDDGYNKLDSSKQNGDTFYAVTVGRSIGIFSDLSEAFASISGYSHSSCVKFKTYEQAQQHMMKNATTTTQNISLIELRHTNQ